MEECYCVISLSLERPALRDRSVVRPLCSAEWIFRDLSILSFNLAICTLLNRSDVRHTERKLIPILRHMLVCAGAQGDMGRSPLILLCKIAIGHTQANPVVKNRIL